MAKKYDIYFSAQSTTARNGRATIGLEIQPPLKELRFGLTAAILATEGVGLESGGEASFLDANITREDEVGTSVVVECNRTDFGPARNVAMRVAEHVGFLINPGGRLDVVLHDAMSVPHSSHGAPGTPGQ